MKKTHTGNIAIYGMTMSGKTQIAMFLKNLFHKSKFPIIVHDFLNDPADWGEVDFISNDFNEVLEVAKNSASCKIFWDDCGNKLKSIGPDPSPEKSWIATQARHNTDNDDIPGHQMIFICQHPTQLHPAFRASCSTIYCFCVGKPSAKTLAEETNCDLFLKASDLKKYHFIEWRRFQKPLLRTLKIE